MSKEHYEVEKAKYRHASYVLSFVYVLKEHASMEGEAWKNVASTGCLQKEKAVVMCR